MPRVSMKHEDAMAAFFQEGNVEVVKSVCAIHQFPPNSKTGEQSDPFTCVRWTLAKLDEDWKVIEGEDPEVVTVRLGGVDLMRPGNLNNPNDLDEEPEDLGREVDTEGNSLYGEPGAKVGGNWAAMEASLRAKGFKPAVIERQYLPDFEGMKCHLTTKATNRKYKNKAGEEVTATELICDRIQTFPYEAKKGKAAGKAAAGAAGKVVGKVEATGKPVTAPAPAESDNGSNGGGDVVESLKAVLSNPSDGFKKSVMSGKDVKRSVFQMQLNMELIKAKLPKEIMAAALALVKDDDQLVALAGEVGFVADVDAGTVTFPA